MGGRGSSSSKKIDPDTLGNYWVSRDGEKERLYLDPGPILEEMGFTVKYENVKWRREQKIESVKTPDGDKMSNNKLWDLKSNLDGYYINLKNGKHLVKGDTFAWKDEAEAAVARLAKKVNLRKNRKIAEQAKAEWKTYLENEKKLMENRRKLKPGTKVKVIRTVNGVRIIAQRGENGNSATGN